MSASGHRTATGIEEFIADRKLPGEFRVVAERCYLPISRWLEQECERLCPLIVGISGAQGTGKSTLAAFLARRLDTQRGCTVAVLSLDDFYLTRAERNGLGTTIHPLLATRGVPGTHDLRMLSSTLEQLRVLQPEESIALPRFDKARDDRADPSGWPVIQGPVDVVILEGWCLGIDPQSAADLATPVNALERVADSAGIWRRYVNEQLAGEYAALFDRLDRLVWLGAPGFDAAQRWRTEQEHRLAGRLPKHGRSMSDAEVLRFMQHFERLTRAALAAPPARADAIVRFDDYHGCIRLEWQPAANVP